MDEEEQTISEQCEKPLTDEELAALQGIVDDEDKPVPAMAPSALLKGLSQLWTYPWGGLDASKKIIDGLMENPALETYRSDLAALETDLEAFSESSETIVGADAYQLEYTRLFIGSLKMYAPPYASYYVDGEEQVYGPTTVEIENLYAQFGIELSDSEHDMPDHLRFLIAFLAMLAETFELAGEDDFAYAYAGFKEDYIATWINDFSAKVNEFAEHPFFKRLISFTMQVL